MLATAIKEVTGMWAFPETRPMLQLRIDTRPNSTTIRGYRLFVNTIYYPMKEPLGRLSGCLLAQHSHL